MSAYVCNPEHIGVLANAMSRANIRINGHRLHPQEMAPCQRQLRQHRGQVSRRVGFMSGGCSLIAFRAQCTRKQPGPDPNLKPIDFIKIAQGFAYQSCEHKEWMEPSFLNELETTYNSLLAHMIRQMPGYDDAPWHLRARAGCARSCRHNSNDASVVHFEIYRL